MSPSTPITPLAIASDAAAVIAAMRSGGGAAGVAGEPPGAEEGHGFVLGREAGAEGHEALRADAVAGLVACDSALERRATHRVARISAELPTVLEFLALSLAAGEGLLDALRRVARVGSGELAGELGRVVADVGTGIPVTRAFDDLALPSVSRLVD
ncbi:type II secretion system F family protein [Clavibacter sp. Sh2141]|uniref:type II secretion system F family protein n=1 Tax=Clavibacter sp. Sh2141 TaxID=3395374 RepID=UPI0039BD8830